VALVTGGATGLGRAIALELSAAECSVAVNYSRSQREADTLVNRINEAGGCAMAVQGDVSDEVAVRTMVDRIEKKLGPVDVLINNAGTTRYIPIREIHAVTVQDWRRIFDVNVLGAFLCAQAVVPTMMERGKGKILNTATNSVYLGSGSSLPYVVSKAALVSLTQALAKAFSPQVQVNAVAPGWMLTGWVDSHLPPEKADELRSEDAHVVPVDDVARAALELIVNDSITGQVVVIDRGELWA